ncbi:hypothetical protein HOLleu_42612 [Holothuria leucospilota]|uniref:Reverse transcriptase domain-containing protein n=1 Tax=Holothuria leucospilota TaxID=206669 RepID=A0A9Q0YCT5_HOLLE|nr:hypothetical protein HOLleu_42612 [Holothuria leucospilota]
MRLPLPTIAINDSRLVTVDNFRYLGSLISSNVNLDAEINARIGRAATVMSKLRKRVWENKHLTLNTKMKVYQACVLSTLLYGSETWATDTKQGTCLGTTWEDKVTNSEVLSKAKLHTIFARLSERRLRWFGRVHRIKKCRIPRGLLYGQLERGSHPRGRPFGSGIHVRGTFSQHTLTSPAGGICFRMVNLAFCSERRGEKS